MCEGMDIITVSGQFWQVKQWYETQWEVQSEKREKNICEISYT
jgi:hypothetical protein